MKPSLRSRKAGNRNASFPQQSRVPSNRYEAVNLSEWLQENLEMLAQKFNNDSASRNVPENILGLTSAATQLFNTALLELSRQAKLRMCDPGLTTARSTGQAIRSTVFVEDLDTNRSTLTSCSQDLRQESIASGSPPKATFSGFADRRKMRASVMANDLLKQMEVLRDEYVGLDELDSSDVASLKSQNEKLQDALNECKREVEAMMEQITVLETQVEEIPTIRYKLEEAKHEHQEAVSKISLLTPRPPVSLSIHRDKIGLEACRRLERAINEHRDWPPNTLAQYLLGEGVACNDEGGKESFGCLGKLVREDCFALGALKEAILEHNVGWFLRYCTKSQAGWIETQISTGCCVESLTQYLTGLSESGAPLSQEWWGCMSNVWNGGRLLAASELQGMIEGAFEPTLERVVELEKKLAELQTNFDRKGLQQ
ncbi:hypothetical protein BSKO_01450 [Bryopsis sp. KO-2023]|nr:hypothetical protein BSKO_01450 [Bryopsis sp. KO-2023]